jgi:hypothetical protein
MKHPEGNFVRTCNQQRAQSWAAEVQRTAGDSFSPQDAVMVKTLQPSAATKNFATNHPKVREQS